MEEKRQREKRKKKKKNFEFNFDERKKKGVEWTKNETTVGAWFKRWDLVADKYPERRPRSPRVSGVYASVCWTSSSRSDHSKGIWSGAVGRTRISSAWGGFVSGRTRSCNWRKDTSYCSVRNFCKACHGVPRSITFLTWQIVWNLGNWPHSYLRCFCKLFFRLKTLLHFGHGNLTLRTCCKANCDEVAFRSPSSTGLYRNNSSANKRKHYKK